MTIRSPKTAHQGKSARILPIFPELYPYLAEGFEMAEEGSTHIITRYRDTRQNLRTQAHRIIRKAGQEPWAKVFQNCRSSRETELAEDYPIQVVTAWLGNSPQIAAKHYLQVTEDHYRRAVHFPAQCASEQVRKASQNGEAASQEWGDTGRMQKETAQCGNTRPYQAPRLGLEPRT